MFQTLNSSTVLHLVFLASNKRHVIFGNLAVLLASLSALAEGQKRPCWWLTGVRRESQMLPGTAFKLAKAHLKRPHKTFSRQLAVTDKASFKSALLIETQAIGAFRMPRSLDPGGLASTQINWLGSEH